MLGSFGGRFWAPGRVAQYSAKKAAPRHGENNIFGLPEPGESGAQPDVAELPREREREALETGGGPRAVDGGRVRRGP